MHHDAQRRHRAVVQRASSRRVLVPAMVAALAVLLAACQPVTFGSPGAQVGNDVVAANCPASQPTPSAPCGPQPMLWAAINGPFDNYDNGDPYATRCAQGGGVGTGCTATNPSYRSTGYAYVIDVDAADVGVPLTLQGYDIGTYPRRVGAGGVNALDARTVSVATTNGSSAVTAVAGTFVAADVNQPIAGTWCVTSCASLKISSVTSATTAVLSASAGATGTWPASIGYDCNTSKAPFNTTAYAGMGGANCQTGDDSDTLGQNFDVQLYDNDGSGAVTYAAPLPGCHLARSAADLTAAPATYKNHWTDVCTFTPAKKGPYAFRVRNSGIDGMADQGVGTNGYALKVLGGAATKLHALDDQSVFITPAGPTTTAYLIDVPPSAAGKKLLVDLYDVGDGVGSSPATIQVKAPPGGAPSATPAGSGVTVPAAGVATACRHNSVGSTSIGPATPDAAAACTVTTHDPALPAANIYNGKWLRIEVTLDPAYTCTTDCWWTLHWDRGTAGFAVDRLTYTAKVV